MKIQSKDFYYGVVLNQIAEYPFFTGINKITDKEGLYQINSSHRVLIKYATAEKGEWRFYFSIDDLVFIAQNHDHLLFFALVCGEETICLLDKGQLEKIVDLEATKSQWVGINFDERCWMQARGSIGRLEEAIPHNAFPKRIFIDQPNFSEEYSWPPLCKLSFYRDFPTKIYQTENRLYDLSDNITNYVSLDEPDTVYFGVSTVHPDWEEWNEETLGKVEKLIHYDLGFDGFTVNITRMSQAGRLCHHEFVWELEISVK